MRASLLIVFLLTATAAFAEERKLTGDEISALLAEKTVVGTDAKGKQWKQVFQKGGLTIYSQGDANSNGFWRVKGDQYCSQWPPNDSWACYDMTGEGDHATFVSSTGTTQPIRVALPACSRTSGTLRTLGNKQGETRSISRPSSSLR